MAVNDKKFENRVVMITGAASGFGADAARRFAASGAKLALSDLNGDALAAVVTELRSSGVSVMTDTLDVSIEADIQSHVAGTIATYGQLDIAINNAGIGHAMMPLTDLDTDIFDKVMRINTRGVFLGMKHQLPAMLERKEGVILNVASAAGVLGAGYLSAYAASKHAVVGLTRAAADEVARKGIRINALCPAFASTPLFDEMADEIGERRNFDREAAYSHISSRIPMRRVASIGEIVQAMIWACDPENSFMTGQTLSIDGGLTAI